MLETQLNIEARKLLHENTIKVMGNFVDGEIIWEDSHARTALDQAPQNILLNPTVDDSYMKIPTGAHVEWCLGADLLDEIDLLRIHKRLILVSIIFLANGDSSQRRTLLSEISHDSTGIDASD